VIKPQQGAADGTKDHLGTSFGLRVVRPPLHLNKIASNTVPRTARAIPLQPSLRVLPIGPSSISAANCLCVGARSSAPAVKVERGPGAYDGASGLLCFI
jgi:hypothetical protein